jgi:hypothetical protein
MDVKSLFGGVAIGKDTSGNLKPSFNRLAVKDWAGRFVSMDPDHETLIDNVNFVIDGADSYVYRIPVKEVNKGDVIIKSDNPFDALFVLEQDNGQITGLNPLTKNRETYSPPHNLLLQGAQFFVKAISLVDAVGDGDFGRNLLPLILLSDGFGTGTGNTGSSSNLTSLILLQTLGGRAIDLNKLLPFLVLSDSKGDGAEKLLALQGLGVELAGPNSATSSAPRSTDTTSAPSTASTSD